MTFKITPTKIQMFQSGIFRGSKHGIQAIHLRMNIKKSFLSHSMPMVSFYTP